MDTKDLPLCRECGVYRTGHVGRRCPRCRGIIYVFLLPGHLQHLPRGHRDRVAEEQRMLEEHRLLLRSRGEGAVEVEPVNEAVSTAT